MSVDLERPEDSRELGYLTATYDSLQMVLGGTTDEMFTQRKPQGKIWRTQVAQQIELAT